MLSVVPLPLMAADRPNVVVLLADDMRWDMMKCAGNAIIQTPHLDALAKDGTRFRNAFVTTAICAASRASLLTGLHERTHRYTFGTKPITAEHTAISYPAQLKKAGYRTGFVGKFGVGVTAGATATMFDSFQVLNRTPYWKKQTDGTLKHVTDIKGERAIAFLDNMQPGQPFCLSVSFNAPNTRNVRSAGSLRAHSSRTCRRTPRSAAGDRRIHWVAWTLRSRTTVCTLASSSPRLQPAQVVAP